MSEQPLAIELIDKAIAKHKKEQHEHVQKREAAKKDMLIAQDCIDMYESFILDLQQSKEAILAAQPPVITAEPPYTLCCDQRDCKHEQCNAE